jgi:hypothetical protein
MHRRRWINLSLSIPPDMPERKKYHYMIMLYGGNIFVDGGHDDKDVDSNSCFLYESEKNEWKKFPDMCADCAGIYLAHCGVFKKEDGEEEIILIGRTTTSSVDIFSIKYLRWRSGMKSKAHM